MAQKTLLALLVIFPIWMKSEAQGKAISPIKNESIERSILYLPQEYIKDEVNDKNLFLTAKVGTPISYKDILSL